MATFEGYKRTPEVTDKMADALMQLLYQYPDQRLGQLIANLATGVDLFNVHDEEIIERMTEAVHGFWRRAGLSHDR